MATRTLPGRVGRRHADPHAQLAPRPEQGRPRAQRDPARLGRCARSCGARARGCTAGAPRCARVVAAPSSSTTNAAGSSAPSRGRSPLRTWCQRGRAGRPPIRTLGLRVSGASGGGPSVAVSHASRHVVVVAGQRVGAEPAGDRLAACRPARGSCRCRRRRARRRARRPGRSCRRRCRRRSARRRAAAGQRVGAAAADQLLDVGADVVALARLAVVGLAVERRRDRREPARVVHRVEAGAAGERVGAGVDGASPPADRRAGSDAARDVVAAVAGERVVALAAEQRVVARRRP